MYVATAPAPQVSCSLTYGGVCSGAGESCCSVTTLRVYEFISSGLTVSLYRDAATGDYALEAGALVLADQGTVLVCV